MHGLSFHVRDGSGVAGSRPPSAGGQGHDRPDDDQENRRQERDGSAARARFEALERGAEQDRIELPGLEQQRRDGELPGEQDADRGRPRVEQGGDAERQEEGERRHEPDPACVFEQQSRAGCLAGSGERDRGRRGDRESDRDQGQQEREPARDAGGEEREPRAAGDNEFAEDARRQVAAAGVDADQDRGDGSDLGEQPERAAQVVDPTGRPVLRGIRAMEDREDDEGRGVDVEVISPAGESPGRRIALRLIQATSVGAVRELAVVELDLDVGEIVATDVYEGTGSR